MKIIKITICFLIIVFLSCGLVYGKGVFKYFLLERLDYIENIIYSDKKALNNIVIEMKDGYGSINILCIPFTHREYKEHILKRSQIDRFNSTQESITLEISGRKLKASKRIIDQNSCCVLCDDYYGGVALFLTYFGDCDAINKLESILACMKYCVSKETIEKARSDFLDIMNSIEKMDIPIYSNASHIKREYSLLGFTKRITFDVKIDTYSVKIRDFYKEFLSTNGWKPLVKPTRLYKTGDIENWHDDKLFFTWTDRTGEILAKLLILSQPINKDQGLTTQTVFIDVTPCIIMEWGARMLD